MEANFCLPPRAQALARFYASTLESLSRLARRRQHHQKLACRPNPWRLSASIGLLFILLAVTFTVSGCGANYTVTAAGIGPFQASTSNVDFGTVPVGQTANSSMNLVNQGSTPIQVSDLKVTGSTFSITSPTILPFTVAANGGTYSVAMQFQPNAAGDATGQLMVSSTSTSSPSLKIKLQGKGSGSGANSPALSSLSCSQSSFTGSGSDACTVTLTAAAGGGGFKMSLSSNNSAVSVPGSVTVPNGATSAGFTATVSAVTTAQNATLTASGGGTTQNYTIALGAYGAALQLSTASMNFGSETVNTTSATQSVTLTSSGTAPLTIDSAALSGAGFTVSGMTFPTTLNPGQTASLAISFDPTVAGTDTGSITITDNASPSTATISLSGTGLTTAGVLSGLSCAASTFTGSGSDACTVSLSAAAGSSGLAVSLSSNDSAVTVPASVTVPAGATSAGFTATVAAVTTAQNATLTASAGGTTQTYTIALGAAVPGLTLSTTSLNFGSVTVNTSSTPQSVTLTSSGTAPLTINSAALSGAGFTVSGMTFPTTLNPGQTAVLSVVFDPTVTGTATGSITISDNASPGSATISLSGTGQATAGVLSGVSCTTSSFTGSGSDACTVSLSAAAGSSGLAVSLSSNNSAVTVPASVTVPAGATSASFTAAVSAVTSTQTAALSASAGGVTVSYSLQLNAATVTLTLGSTSVSFGDVTVNTTVTQSVSLTSSGTSQLTINSATVTGAGFGISGLTFPLTLNPGQSATLNVTFDPTVTGTATGAVILSTNASSGGTATISLSANGVAKSYTVSLTWSAPTNSTDPVAGYNVYRATGTSTSYQLLNTSVDTQTAYTDSNVQNGTSYSYYVESVDAQGNQSIPSNIFTASIP
jgi:hypothetical protein